MKIKKIFEDFDQRWRGSLSEHLEDPIVRKSVERHAWWMDHGVLRTLYDNEFEIADGVYRSNQPSPSKIEYWSKKGVKTILNLRGESNQGSYFLEKEACEKMGIKLINFKIAASSLKSKEVLLELCDIFKNINTPMLIHCKSGSDRAGLASFIYLVTVKKIHPAIAAKQLSLKYLHLKWYITGVLDYMVDQYVKAFNDNGIQFEDWLRSGYDREKLLDIFFSGRGKWDFRIPKDLPDITKSSEKIKTPIFWFFESYVKKNLATVIMAFLFMAIEGSMAGFISYSVKELFDSVFIPQNRNSVWIVSLAIFSIFAIRAISGFLQRTLILKAGIDIVSNIQKDISAHIINLDYDFFFKNSPGDLIERIKGDGQIIEFNFVQVARALGRDTISLIALLSVAIWIDWKWALISFIGLPLLIVPILLLQKYIHSISSESRRMSARTTTLLDEAFHGIAAIKLNGIESYIRNRLSIIIDKTRRAWFRSELGIAGMPALIDLVAAVGFLGVMVVGGMEIIDGEKTVGEFMSFFTAMALIFEPLRRLSNVAGQFQLLSASLDRLYHIAKLSPKIISKEKRSNNKEAKDSSIEFKNVCAAYGDEEVISNVSFHIKAGQFVGIVGLSGSGKSTILNLISRLIEPTSGHIFIGGKPLKEIPIEDLRRTISVVPQENNLFDDSIFQNITLGSRSYKESDLKDVLNETVVSDFIKSFENGINFQTGPRGLNLSGGQRQRIAIARALLRKPAILLLDEPTSALDSETESKIQNVLGKFLDNRTVIMTTHKLENVSDASQILVFQDGKVVDNGTHKELIDRAGPYLNLWTL